MLTYLIVGIGNPEKEYSDTRHNIGFTFLDFLAKKMDAGNFSVDSKSEAQLAKTKFEVQGKNANIVLAKPETYVNVTGPVVKKIIGNWKLEIGKLIVVHDDLDIPFGKIKLSFDKNSGGHRGVESVMKALKTKKFWRLRLGTQNSKLLKAYGLPEKKKNDFVRDFVLAKFTPSEREELKNIFKSAFERLAQKTN